ncbi:hypothetical protein BDY21DRAFT_210002 [Lineolata rhizophorae]|uniref:Glycosyl hydrolase family 13 catalytic domain-containing protein n=1 Tax=Lineolata rhizophorae TaxID=578093 RepID=A0A6A6P4A2_9PEZI|nr:hypothetical protein BDY21DRAFT_210002 [Lineolata rhizophorae]
MTVPVSEISDDIPDHPSINAPYELVKDFKPLMSEGPGRAMKLILDLVANHTSHLHKWFLELRSLKNSVKSDRYILGTVEYRKGVAGANCTTTLVAAPRNMKEGVCVLPPSSFARNNLI